MTLKRIWKRIFGKKVYQIAFQARGKRAINGKEWIAVYQVTKQGVSGYPLRKALDALFEMLNLHSEFTLEEIEVDHQIDYI